jgi:hypothetical protein
VTLEVAGEYLRPIKADDGVPVAARRRLRGYNASSKLGTSFSREIGS